MTLANLIRRHPILAYIILVLAWSWGFWSFLFLYMGPGGLMHNPPPISFLFVALGGIGPLISGLFLTAIVYGRDGMRGLWRRLDYHPIGRWWWALLLIPLITAITPLLRWIAGYEVNGSAMLSAVLTGLGIGIGAGLMEEFGWRGFLLPHLLKRYSPLVSTLLLGLVWGGLWHGYADVFGVGDKDWATVPLILLLGPCLLTAWSLVITRVYEHTQANLLLAILMHASLSSSAFAFGQTYATLEEELAWTAISVGVAWLGAVLIWFALARRNVLPLNTRGTAPAE